MNGRNTKHTWRTHQNLVKISIRSSSISSVTQAFAFWCILARQGILLRDRDPCFFLFILRWFHVHFVAILHDLGHPSGSLILFYECSSEQVKIRNFHHFFKRFWHPQNRVQANVVWVSWKINTKRFRKHYSNFGPSILRPPLFWGSEITVGPRRLELRRWN